MTHYVCFGVPYYIGKHHTDRTEVETVERSGIADEIGAEWVNIEPDFAAAPDPLSAVNRALAQAIAAHPNCTPLIFASDCCSALGAVKGLSARHNDLAVLWFDAHGDFNTEETTPSGFLGGMPLAWLVGDGDQRYMRGIDLLPIAQADVIITDARDLDPEESVRLKESAITHLKKVDELFAVSLPNKPLYVHFDTDVVDIVEMPGMGYPAPNGPPLDMCVTALERVAQDGNVVGLLFSLWNGSLPTDGKSLAGVLRLARAFVDGKGSART